MGKKGQLLVRLNYCSIYL